MFRALFYPLKSLFTRKRTEQLTHDELQFHIEQETRQNIALGMPPEQARRQALTTFGGSTQVHEECREAWGTQLMENLWRDVTYALRTLRKDWGYTLVAVATLALGIGSNTAIYSVLRSVVLRSLPVADGDRVIALTATDQSTGREKPRFSFPELRDYRERTKLLDKIEELHTMTFTLLGRAEPENVQTGVVPADYFDFLGIRPYKGRTFASGEDRHEASPVLVLTHRYWMTSFGGNPNVVGTTVRMNDRVHTIVGILPPLPEFPNPIDLYMPTSSCPTRGTAAFEHNARGALLRLYGRMKPGVTAAEVETEFGTVFAQYRAQHSDVYPATTVFKANVTPLRDVLSERAKPTLYMLFSITALVLLIACASVANLSLARMLRREREMAIRTAIGGTRARLLQQFIVEGLIVSLTGGAAGLIAAASVLTLLSKFVARLSPRSVEIGLDAPVMLFCAAVSIATGVLFCALPAWRTRIDLVSATRDGSAGSTAGVSRQTARRMLVSAQVAFSFVVLIAAGLLMRSFLNLTRVSLGFETQRVISMTLNPNWSHVNTTEKFLRFYDQLLERVRRTPGVLSAAVSGNVPLAQSLQATNGIVMEGQAPDAGASPVVNLAVASDGYFDTLRIPVLQGRVFGVEDKADTPQVAVIDASMAAKRWPGQAAVGRRFRLADQKPWITVVGVVGSVHMQGVDRDPAEQVYLPLAQAPAGTDLLVRTAGAPLDVIRDLRSAVYQIDPDQAIVAVKTMDEIVGENLAAPQLMAKLVAMLAALTLIITIAGIGGVAAVSTDHRKAEIGVRLALGAMPGRLVAMIVRQEMVMVAVGLAIGLLAAGMVAQALSKFLFGTRPTDVFTFLASALLMLAAAAGACLIPAVRTARIDPIKTLRSE